MGQLVPERHPDVGALGHRADRRQRSAEAHALNERLWQPARADREMLPVRIELDPDGDLRRELVLLLELLPGAFEELRDVPLQDLSLIHISEPTRRTPISY